MILRIAFAALTIVAATTAAHPEPRVIATLTGDFDENGRADVAVLIGESRVTLAIFEETAPDGGFGLAAEGPDIAWMGSLAEAPRIALTEGGSIAVTSSNFGIGRHKWEMVLTIAHRSGAYRVAGITYVSFDTLAPETSPLRCDLNLLTGAGTITGPGDANPERAVKVAEPAVAIEAFSADRIVPLCRDP